MRVRVVQYVSWCWQKSGNDGRRASGRVVKRGVWHVVAGDPVADAMKVGDAKTVCGRRIDNGLYHKFTCKPSDHPDSRVCRRCRG